MITNPVRMYLLLLFVAVFGIGGYMLIKQNNDDFDNNSAQAGQNLKATAVPTVNPSATPAASPTATPSTSAINTTIDANQEASTLESFLSSIPSSDFDSSTLSSSSIGL